MKRILLIGLLILLFLMLVGIIITMNTRELNYYYDKTVGIKQEDSLNLKVIDVWLNRGYLFLNDSLYIWGSKIEEPNIKLTDIIELKLPFYIKKAVNDDTLWIISNKETCFFVLLKVKNYNNE